MNDGQESWRCGRGAVLIMIEPCSRRLGTAALQEAHAVVCVGAKGNWRARVLTTVSVATPWLTLMCNRTGPAFGRRPKFPGLGSLPRLFFQGLEAGGSASERLQLGFQLTVVFFEAVDLRLQLFQSLDQVGVEAVGETKGLGLIPLPQ